MKTQRTLLIFLFVTSLFAVESRRKCLVVGLDGTRGDVFYQTTQNTPLGPNFVKLMEVGKFASCVDPYDSQCAKAHSGFASGHLNFSWSTSPGWASVVTGVDVSKTLVAGNDIDEQDPFVNTTKLWPTFFHFAKAHNFTTAASGTPNFLSNGLSSDPFGIIDYECGVKNYEGLLVPIVPEDATSSCNLDFRQALSEDPICDNKTVSFAIDLIQQGAADVIMTHFNNIDSAGHEYGFKDQEPYMLAISAADFLFGKLVETIKKRCDSSDDEWLIVITADHGGHDTSHDTDFIFDRLVPFVVGTICTQNITLQDLTQPVHQYDAMPTVLHWLGIPVPPGTDGFVQAIRNL